MSPPIGRSPADQATRDRISHTALGSTLFVEAGAGTGKTSQLVERIAQLVLTDGVRMSSIAAITFTEAAAAELATRVRVRFERALLAASGAEMERCRDALADLDLAAVSTLHAFASRILSEFAVAAGLPPRVHVLDDIASQIAHEHRWERFVDGLYDTPEHDPVLTRATVLNIRLEPTYPGESTFKELASHLAQNWDRLGPIVATEPPAITLTDFGPFDRAVAAVAELPSQCTDPEDSLLLKLVARLPTYRAIVEIDDHDRKLRLIKGLDPLRVGNSGRKQAWHGDVSAAREVVGALNEASTEVVSEATDVALRHLLVLTARHVLDSALDRRAEGGLEFHDLLVLARDLLRSSPEARRRLHDRFRHILLDEFQDTDPLQIELATLIASSPSPGPPDSWDHLDVGPGRLFFVGDPKQSIYRFRRADIELFLDARDHFAPDGGWERLTTNFRTLAPILDWINDLFLDLMPEELPGAQPGYQPLIAHRELPASGPSHLPVLLGGPHPDPKVRAAELRQAEAAEVAAVVADVSVNPEAWPVHDDIEGWRPARLSDITILVPTRTSLPFLRQALDQAALPYRLATGTLVYNTQEVRDLLSALRAVDDPTDTLNTVAALRSPLYACSDIDLHSFHSNGGRFDLRSEPPTSAPMDHPVRSALAHLRTLWSDRWWSTPSALLDRLIAERHARGLAFGDPRPADVWRRLRFLADQARGFEESSTQGLRAFLDWADLQRADGARVHEPLLPETDDDAVRIMTIHAAKGLEFPITILSGLTTARAGRRPGPSIVWGPGDRPEVSMSSTTRTREFAPRADIEDWMDEHEKLRLLYVALTRARDHLIVSCHHKANAACQAKVIWDHSHDRPTLWRRLPELEYDDMGADPELALGAEAISPTLVGQLSLPLSAAASPVERRDRWIKRRATLVAASDHRRIVSATALGERDSQHRAGERDSQHRAGECHNEQRRGPCARGARRRSRSRGGGRASRAGPTSWESRVGDRPRRACHSAGARSRRAGGHRTSGTSPVRHRGDPRARRDRRGDGALGATIRGLGAGQTPPPSQGAVRRRSDRRPGRRGVCRSAHRDPGRPRHRRLQDRSSVLRRRDRHQDGSVRAPGCGLCAGAGVRHRCAGHGMSIRVLPSARRRGTPRR